MQILCRNVLLLLLTINSVNFLLQSQIVKNKVHSVNHDCICIYDLKHFCTILSVDFMKWRKNLTDSVQESHY